MLEACVGYLCVVKVKRLELRQSADVGDSGVCHAHFAEAEFFEVRFLNSREIDVGHARDWPEPAARVLRLSTATRKFEP